MKTISFVRNMIYTGDLILVNRDYPYRGESSYKALMPIDSLNVKVLLARHVVSIYNNLINKLKAQNRITVVSGWRSQKEQEEIFNESLMKHGKNFTSKYVALPGHSEHQTGLALDLALNQPDIDFLRPCFPNTGVCASFRKKADRFGFIERYPEGKEDITGIAYEPWHFRYVGFPHSIIMKQTGDTLEEYHARIRQYLYGRSFLKYDFGSFRTEISYLPADKEVVRFLMDEDTPYTVSGNNMDGFVITVWRAGR